MALESVKKLKEKEVPHRLIKLSDDAVSVEDVVRESEDDVKTEEICKAMVVKDTEGKKYALLLKGKDEIDFSKVKEATEKETQLLSKRELKEETGKKPGAVCPLLLDMPILVDKKVMKMNKINFGSGDLKYGLEMSPRNLDKVINFKTVNIHRPKSD